MNRRLDSEQTPVDLWQSPFIAASNNSSETSNHSAQSDASKQISNYDRTVLEFFGPGEGPCGYCKSEADGRISHDMKAHLLKVDDYQDILDRYWRRSGNYCYRPFNEITCCPNYSITCKATNFVLSRSQRRCIERVNSYIINGNNEEPVLNRSRIGYPSQIDAYSIEKTISSKLIDMVELDKLRHSEKRRTKRFIASCDRKSKKLDIHLNDAIRLVIEKNVVKSARPKYILENYLYPLQTANDNSSLIPKHKLEFKLIPAKLAIGAPNHVDKVNLIQKYQLAVHKEEKSLWTSERYVDFLVSTPLVMEKMAGFGHVEDSSKYKFDEENLCSSLRDNDSYSIVDPPPIPTHYGTYHCEYYLDGKLIAVGILDVLPKCLTTVYFFYDPEYAFLNLGIYSGLVEISMVRQISNEFKGSLEEKLFKHYYLGFYVHVCKKMHYKPSFKPSYLLCNETYEYIPTGECLKKLEAKKYTPFSSQARRTPICITHEELLSIKIVIQRYGIYTSEEYMSELRDKLSTQKYQGLVKNVFARSVHLLGRDVIKRIYLDCTAVHRLAVQMRNMDMIDNRQNPSQA